MEPSYKETLRASAEDVLNLILQDQDPTESLKKVAAELAGRLKLEAKQVEPDLRAEFENRYGMTPEYDLDSMAW